MTRKSTLTPKDLELVKSQQVRNVLKKIAAGKTPTAREQRLLDEAAEGPPRRKNPKGQEEDAVWLGPAEFLRWLPSQGITLARKNFYARYYGKQAKHPLHVSPDGKKIHKWKGAELIKLIQSKESGDGDRVIRERQAAEALFKTAQAQRAVVLFETVLGQRVRTHVVTKVWSDAVENLKNELRTIQQNVPDELVRALQALMTIPEEIAVKLRATARTTLENAHHGALKHMAVTYADGHDNSRAA